MVFQAMGFAFFNRFQVPHLHSVFISFSIRHQLRPINWILQSILISHLILRLALNLILRQCTVTRNGEHHSNRSCQSDI